MNPRFFRRYAVAMALLIPFLLSACTSSEPDVEAKSQYVSTLENQPVDIALQVVTRDGLVPSIDITRAPSNGQLAGVAPDLVYTPDSDFVGEDSFEFVARVESGETSTGVVIVKVVPDPSVDVTLPGVTAYDQLLTTTRNQPLEIRLQGASEDGGILRFEVLGQPSHGTLTGQLQGINPVIVYTPALDFSGTDFFEFAITNESGSSATGRIDLNVLDQVSPVTDTDGDGLLDLDELNRYGTNPELVDTDGDGFSDFDELVRYGFNPEVNNFRFNPLIADTPEVDIRIVSVPDIRINYTLTDGSSRTVGTERSQTSSQSVSSSYSESESTTVSESHTVSVEISSTVSVSAEVGLFDPPKAETEASITATAGYSYENTTTREQVSSWSQEQSRENSETLARSESVEQNNSVSASDGEISIAVEITNRGHISYTLSNLYLSANYIRPRGANPMTPIGNLSFDSSGGSFPEVTLSPGQSTGTLVFRGKNVNMEKIKEILGNSKGFSVQPTLYTLLDQNKVAYNFSSTGIVSNDAMIMVDYNGNRGLENITRMVAVNHRPGRQITLAEAMNRVLRLNLLTTTDADGNEIIQSISGLERQAEEKDGFWLLLHARQVGNDQVETRIYTTPADRSRWEERNPNVRNLVSTLDPDSLELGAGDVVHLVYLQDVDGDGLSNRMEFYYGSDPENPDSDGDGLADGVEAQDGWKVIYEDIYGAEVHKTVYSSPVLVDTDTDGVSDFDEANLSVADDRLRRDPGEVDTDGDGLDDEIDDRSGGALAANAFDNLNLHSSNATVYDDGNNGDIAANGIYSVDLSFGLPDLSAANANGVNDYRVVVLRYLDSSGQNDFPLNEDLKDGRSYILGDTVPCDNGVAGCRWEVVASEPVDLATPPATLSLTETELLDSGNSLTGTPADTAKYAFYSNINGRYIRQSMTQLATSKTERLIIRMKKATFSRVRTVFSQNTREHNQVAAVTREQGWINEGKPTYYVANTSWNCSSGRTAYWPYALGNDGQPTGEKLSSHFAGHCLPTFRAGDGRLDIAWYVYVDGIRRNVEPATYPISGSAGARWSDGERGPLPGLIDKNGSSVDLFIEGSRSSNAVDAGDAVMEIALPAQPGSHLIEFIVTEYDHARGEYSHFVAPPDLLFPGQSRPHHGIDAIRVTRDEEGIWTAKVLPISSNQQDTGWFRGGRNVTRQFNTYPIEWVTRTIRLSDEDMDEPGMTAMQMDLVVEMELEVR